MSDTYYSFLHGVGLQLDFQGSGDIASDLYDLVQNSALLNQEVITLENEGYGASLVPVGQTDTNPFALPNLAPHDTTIVGYGGSLTAGDDAVVESGDFAGEIASQYAKVTDPNLTQIDAGNYAGISGERMLGDLMLDASKQDYSQMIVKEQDQAAPTPAGMATPYIGFENGGTVNEASAVLMQAAATGSVQAAEDLFGSYTFGFAEGQADLQQVVAALAKADGPSNALNIDWAEVTAASATTDPSGDALTATVIATSENGIEFTYTTAYSITVPAESTSVVVTGSNGHFAATGNTLSITGNADYVSDTHTGAISLTGTGNTLTTTATTNIALSGSGDLLVLEGGAVTVSGAAANTTVFGGSGGLTFDAGSGTLVLGSGASTITGSDVVFGGTGTINYTGATGVGDVIGGATHNDTIVAASSGWFEGGSGGMNFIQGSNSGLGTVLQAGGTGDHLVGGAAGGDYFLGGAGSETFTGGNTSGTQAMFGGTGNDLVQLGTGNAIINVGAGALDLTGSGYSTIYQSVTGGVLTLDASAGIQDVYGFRVGYDQVNLSGAGWTDTQQGGSTVLHNSVSGTTYDLHGVTAGLGALS